MKTYPLQSRPKPIVLIILDGWGYREAPEHNAIAAANKPNWDNLWNNFAHTCIAGSGKCVGLPQGQMGNSEVGHLTMGAGRVVYQDLTRIDLAIEDRSFFRNSLLEKTFTEAKAHKKAVHLMGLVSPGGVHSHEKHFHAMIEYAAQKQIDRVYIHAFLDGRDTPPQSALPALERLASVCHKHHCGEIVSLIGRYYAMDRDQRWERIQPAYDLLVSGMAANHAETIELAIQQAYDRGETDEFVSATAIHPAHTSPHTINDGDTVIFMNFRADRARELTQTFIDKNFSAFKRTKTPSLAAFICLSEYDANYQLPTVFPSQSHQDILAEVLSQQGLEQLRIAETEKYAHVTFFFNGGIEKAYRGEHRILVPSPKVSTYDLQPEMSAFQLTDSLSSAIESGAYDVIICNFANPDMVGHTGNFKATVKAIETIDACLGRIIKSLQIVGGELLITADHGNAEQMFDATHNQPHTAHTTNPVPFIYWGRPAKCLDSDGKLSDIAPTLLYLLGLPQPPAMTGKSLVTLL